MISEIVGQNLEKSEIYLYFISYLNIDQFNTVTNAKEKTKYFRKFYKKFLMAFEYKSF